MGAADAFYRMDTSLINTYKYLPLIKAGACALCIIILGLIVLRMLNIRSLAGLQGMTQNVEYIRLMQQRDRNIIFANRVLKLMSSIGKIPLFAYSEYDRSYIQYNLRRAGVHAPGGYRDLTAEEFRGITISVIAALDLVFMIVPIFAAVMLPVSILFVVVITVGGGILPKLVLRASVSGKDSELKREFPDFYLMMHYVLITGAKTPLDRLMRSYRKITESKEMMHFIDVACDHIDTHGELNAMQRISDDFREVAEVGKMCRLIKQMLEGGDVIQELEGFRNELILNKKFEIEKHGDMLIKKAQRSFSILMLLLVQAVFSAAATYFPDITEMGDVLNQTTNYTS